MRDFVWNGGLLRIDHLNCLCESQNTSRSTIGRMISDLSRCLSMAYFKRIYNILTYILTVYETSHWSTRLSMIIKLEQSWIKVVWKLDIVGFPPLTKIQTDWLLVVTDTRISDVSGYWPFHWHLRVFSAKTLWTEKSCHQCLPCQNVLQSVLLY